MDDVLRRARVLEAVEHLGDVTVAEVGSDGTIHVLSRGGRGPLEGREGASLFDVVATRYREGVRAVLAGVLETEQPARLDVAALHADGRARWVHLRFWPMRRPGGERAAAVLAHALDADGGDLRQRLEAATRLESLGTIAAGLAHEINNPLAAVIANLDLALREVAALAQRVQLPQDLTDELNDARDAAERVRVIMRDLRTFSAATADRTGPVDLHRVLESTLRMAWNELRHRSRIVKLYGEIPFVEASEARLAQALLHLVLHVARTRPVGEAERHELRVATTVDGELVRVVIGIARAGSDAVRAAAFEPSSLGWAPNSPDGAATACRILEELGGTVEFARSPATAAFRVHLTPVRRELPAAEVSDLAAPARRGRVLVIDDEPMIGVVVRRTLGAEHEVRTVTSGAAALDLIASGEAFDVILCDVMMPQMSGVEVYETLASTRPHLVSRVIFLTGGAFTPAAREFLEASPNVRIEKPFEHLQLRALVNSRIR